MTNYQCMHFKTRKHHLESRYDAFFGTTLITLNVPAKKIKQNPLRMLNKGDVNIKNNLPLMLGLPYFGRYKTNIQV